MPRRKEILRNVLNEVVSKPKEEQPIEQEKSEEVTDKKVETTPSFVITIPPEKVPIQIKEMSVGNEVTIQLTGNISSSDETGVSIDVKTIEVI
jgi:hypothetical protein